MGSIFNADVNKICDRLIEKTTLKTSFYKEEEKYEKSFEI